MPLKSSTCARLGVALAAAASLIVGNLLPAHAEGPDRKLLYHTHVDAAHIVWEGDSVDTGKLGVKVVDGATPVDADSVYIRLAPDATPDGIERSRIHVPADPSYSFLGKAGDIVWYGPQEVYNGHVPVWAGLGAGAFPRSVEDALYPETLYLELVDTKAPGNFWLFNNVDGKGRLLMSNVGNTHRTNYSLPGSHGHYSWAFSSPGRYDMIFKAHVKTRDGREIVSEPTTVTWLVGSDEQVGLPAGTTQTYPITVPIEDQAFDSTYVDSEDDSSSYENPTIGQDCTRAQSGQYTLSMAWKQPAEKIGQTPVEPTFSLTDPNFQPVSLDDVVFHVPSSKKITIGNDPAINPFLPQGASAYALLAEGDALTPSLVMDNSGMDMASLKESILRIDYMSGPGRVLLTDVEKLVSESESMDSATYRLEENTHAPMVFYFTKPGFYTVTMTLNVVLKDRPTAEGQYEQNYESFSLKFAVGDKEIASSCRGLDGYSSVDTPAPSPDKEEGELPEMEIPTIDPLPVNKDKTILSQGHADIFHVSAHEGSLSVDIKEDITGEHVIRDPKNVILHVKKEAFNNKLPWATYGISKGYVLPANPDGQGVPLLQPGWDTNDVAQAGFNGIDIELSNLQGPGKVLLSTVENFQPVPVLAEKRYELPGTIKVPFPSHVHGTWIFEKPGIYTFDVQAKVAEPSTTLARALRRNIVSEKVQYTFYVGDVEVADGDPSAQPVPPSPEENPSDNHETNPSDGEKPSPEDGTDNGDETHAGEGTEILAATITAHPKEVKAGEKVHIEMSDFKPGENIKISLNSSLSPLSAQADHNGHAVVEMTIPEGSTPGDYRLTAMGAMGTEASTALRILPSESLTESTEENPQQTAPNADGAQSPQNVNGLPKTGQGGQGYLAFLSCTAAAMLLIAQRRRMK